MDIIVHIGTEKTGTTTIQELLYKNREALIECGFYFLQSPGTHNNRELPAYCLRRDRYDEHSRNNFIDSVEKKVAFQEDFLARFFAEIESIPSNVTTVIASSEHFHSQLIYDDEIENLKELLAKKFNNIKIITYLRKQIDAAMSLYSTALLSGQSHDFLEFVSRQCDPDSHYLNYYTYVKKWERVFGKNNLVVRIFDKAEFINGRLIDDFVFQVDPTLVSKLDTEITAKNESINHFGQCLLKSINKHIPQFISGVGFNKNNLELWEVVVGGAKGNGANIDEQNYISLQSRYDESNEALRREYFTDKKSLFNTNLPKSGSNPLSRENEIVLDKIIDILSHRTVPDYYADILSYVAIKIEYEDRKNAHHLMQVASYIRPGCEFIKSKALEYSMDLQPPNRLMQLTRRLRRIYRAIRT